MRALPGPSQTSQSILTPDDPSPVEVEMFLRFSDSPIYCGIDVIEVTQDLDAITTDRNHTVVEGLIAVDRLDEGVDKGYADMTARAWRDGEQFIFIANAGAREIDPETGHFRFRARFPRGCTGGRNASFIPAIAGMMEEQPLPIPAPVRGSDDPPY